MATTKNASTGEKTKSKGKLAILIELNEMPTNLQQDFEHF